MKSNKDLRPAPAHNKSDELLKKPVKLNPIKKSGKDRILIDEEEETDDIPYKKRESILDYFDDEDEDE